LERIPLGGLLEGTLEEDSWERFIREDFLRGLLGEFTLGRIPGEDSLVRIPQGGFLREESSGRIPHGGILGGDSLGRSP
jgi:hypothetical protein